MKTVLVANRKGGCGKTLVAITLASGLAGQGARVGLADADPQKSSLRWLKARPEAAWPIRAVDWTRRLGETPKKLDWLVIDAPGSLSAEEAERLVGEAEAVVAPVMASGFDIDATRRFLKEIEELKRVRRGKVRVHLVANRVRNGARATGRLSGFFGRLGQEPLAWIGERAAYADLAEQGLAVFDRPQRAYSAMRAQWAPVLAKIG